MDPLLYLLAGLLLGVLCGGAVGWLWGTRRAPSLPANDDRLANELRQQVAQRESELNSLRDRSAQAEKAQAGAEARQAAAEKLLSEERDLNQSHADTNQTKANWFDLIATNMDPALTVEDQFTSADLTAMADVVGLKLG